ncbi:hypothetical protein C8R47DRAFT_1219260 [Mycena vitilis]|nr:hypothetical protein C8R47DRAFT_1219260 [Mycena vitilis]
MSRLPQELLDIVVSQLEGDTPTLRACALGCRGLVSLAQTRLFYKVVLNQAAPSERNVKKRSQCQKLSRILDISPHLASLIKDLRIVEDDESRAKWVSTEWRTLSAVLSRLELRRISIRCIESSLDWDRLHRQLKASLQAVFSSPHIDAIQLHGILMLSAPQECALFHIFANCHSSLQQLAFSYSIAKYFTRSLVIPPVWSPKLRSLVIDAAHENVVDILDGLSSPAMDYSRLRTLSLRGFDNVEIGKLLVAIKDRNVLEDLEVRYPYFTGQEAFFHWMNYDADLPPDTRVAGQDGLQFLPNLRAIHLHVCCTSVAHEELAALVRSCAANTGVEKIVLDVFVHNAAIYPVSEWTALAIAARNLNKRVEVFLGKECGVGFPEQPSLEVSFEECMGKAAEALAVPSSGLTIQRSTSYPYLSKIYDSW